MIRLEREWVLVLLLCVSTAVIVDVVSLLIVIVPLLLSISDGTDVGASWG